MKNEDKKRFLELMTGLAEVFSSNLTEAGVRLQFNALNQYSIEQIEQAANIIVKTRRYTSMPVPADFIEAIEGNSDDNADYQISLIKKAIGIYGSYQTPKFVDPVTTEVVSTINWGNLCAMSEKELTFKMKELKELYKTIQKGSSGHVLNAPETLKQIANSATKNIL